MRYLRSPQSFYLSVILAVVLAVFIYRGPGDSHAPPPPPPPPPVVSPVQGPAPPPEPLDLALPDPGAVRAALRAEAAAPGDDDDPAVRVAEAALKRAPGAKTPPPPEPESRPEPARQAAADFGARLARAAVRRVETAGEVTYDASYHAMSYPGGDVPEDRGCCTDFVVRAFRGAGVDLQQEVHEDLSAHLDVYRRRTPIDRPDPSGDHRRVQNLWTFFERKGRAVAITDDPADYLPGDVVIWRMPETLHVGLISDTLSITGDQYLTAHNIGAGPCLEHFLFAYPIVGHFRYGGGG